MKNKSILISFLIIILFNGCFKKEDKSTKFYGNVDVRTQSLAFRVSGKIDSIKFDEGEKIKKGDILATLENSLYEQYLKQIDAEVEVQKALLNKLEKGYRKESIEKAKATLAQKEIILLKSKKDFKRKEELLNKNAISKQEYDNAKEIYDSAKALYDYAKNDLNLLKNGYEKEDISAAIAKLDSLMAQKNEKQINLNDTILYAPNDGTILTRVYEVGSVVNAATPILEIARSDEYWVRSYMSEKFLGKIRQGMGANIYNDSTNKVYKGVVSFISPMAEFTPKNVQTEELRTDLVYRFRIILKNFDENLRQGMPVTIKFPDLEK